MKSTDLTVDKKLVLYSRMLDPVSFLPTTKFLTTIHLSVSDATGHGIAIEILSYLESKNINIDKLCGFGSNGASVMTGRKTGVTGKLLEHNPAIINIHCMAHRLALCTSQAADKVPYLKEYQQTVTNIFYYFKHSAVFIKWKPSRTYLKTLSCYIQKCMRSDGWAFIKQLKLYIALCHRCLPFSARRKMQKVLVYLRN